MQSDGSMYVLHILYIFFTWMALPLLPRSPVTLAKPDGFACSSCMVVDKVEILFKFDHTVLACDAMR